MPDTVQEAWGRQAAEDFSHWLDEYVQEHAVRRDEYREVLSGLDGIEERFDVIEERFNRVDERFEQMADRLNRLADRFEHRFDRLDQKLDAQSSEFNQRLDNQSQQLNDRIDRLHEQTRVMVRGTIGTIALFGTIVPVLLAIAEFGG